MHSYFVKYISCSNYSIAHEFKCENNLMLQH